MLSSIKEYQPGPEIPESIWMTLGLPSRGTMLHDLVREGLPFGYLPRIATLLQVQPGVIASAICVSHATLARRAKTGCFRAAESDRLISLVTVFQEAIALFEGDISAASRWMKSSVRGLGKRPLDMVETRVETEAVLDLLGRLKNGVVA